jgi:hypothetical protein
VANEHRGLNAPGSPELGERHLNRKQRWLGVRRAIDRAVRARLRVDDLVQRLLQLEVQVRRAAIEGLAEHRFDCAELFGHLQVLRPLPGEHEGDTGGR